MKNSSAARIAIILGSDSDIPTIEPGIKILEEFGLEYELRLLSAHRTPDQVAEFARTAADRGISVIIAGAGMAAALPGVVAAHTHLPVIGIPVAAGPLVGFDALLSISQMPPGVPVATMTIGSPGAKNAALMAVRIVALNNPEMTQKLKVSINKQQEEVIAKDKKFGRSTLS